MSPPLAAYARGHAGVPGHPFVFLHGLTFDHQMWAPVIAALPPRRRALAIDLPGHGASPALNDHRLESVVAAVHDAVQEAELEPPVLVGHSLGALVATLYAVEHPVAGVVNVDAPLSTEPFARLVQSLAPQLRGEGFERTWAMFRDSMHVERVAPSLRSLLAAGDRVERELVLSYWAELLETSPEDMAALTERLLETVRDAAVPYVAIYAETRPWDELAYVAQRVPQAQIETWPCSHHFPPLADPDRFAALLVAFAASVPDAVRR
ncbi:alpha/beta fold hydrolase [Solirubrobacter ginsenosidimutans]|uniref:Alpha/beta fold hydrolase n=1 Tax=Solirubrobacter ginsenosidimutans TaxID=490573 RepID=A0A9X3MY21_9ACTN|nr:alpha/beta hydrolase [Solirubrobacter ginsenosidimutans]MDA0161513.1 alpha/beta fold hydrolase [Solirubrobacter ginsenosidimutans]